MNSGKINKNAVDLATFEVSAPYATVFADVADDFPQAFNKVASQALTIGSLTEPTISGNYENTYCKSE